jgi:hypothetical protein
LKNPSQKRADGVPQSEGPKFKPQYHKKKKKMLLVPHTCNPIYLGGRDQEGYRSRHILANSLLDFIIKITRPKWTGGVAEVVEHLFCKCEALSSNSSLTKKGFYD